MVAAFGSRRLRERLYETEWNTTEKWRLYMYEAGARVLR